MRNILMDISAVNGVIGAFVVSDGGKLLEHVMSPGVSQASPPQAVMEAVAKIVAAAKTNGKSKMGDIDLMYDGGRLILKPLGTEGCLCLVCIAQINVALLNVTANLAARKLEQMIAEMKAAGALLQTQPREQAGTKAAPEPMTKTEMLAVLSRTSTGRSSRKDAQ
jgi:predicted regulator of Ras-like GTPase activity (Roadblock/LC7/MglB family)